MNIKKTILTIIGAILVLINSSAQTGNGSGIKLSIQGAQQQSSNSVSTTAPAPIVMVTNISIVMTRQTQTSTNKGNRLVEHTSATTNINILPAQSIGPTHIWQDANAGASAPTYIIQPVPVIANAPSIPQTTSGWVDSTRYYGYSVPHASVGVRIQSGWGYYGYPYNYRQPPVYYQYNNRCTEQGNYRYSMGLYTGGSHSGGGHHR